MPIRSSRKIISHGGFANDYTGFRSAVMNGYGRTGSNNDAGADRISVPAAQAHQPSRVMTIEMVVTTWALRNSQTLFSQWNVGSNQARLAIFTGTGGAAGLILASFAVSGGSDTQGGSVVGSVSTLAVDKKSYIVLLVNLAASGSARAQFYYDTVLDAGATVSSTMPASLLSPSTSTTEWGFWPGQSNGSANPWYGLYEHGAIWNRLLSPAEIVQRQQELIFGSRTNLVSRVGLVHEMPFDQDFISNDAVVVPVTTPAFPTGPRLIPSTPEGNAISTNYTGNPIAANAVDTSTTTRRVLCMGDSITAGTEWDDADLTNPKIAWRQALYDYVRREGKSLRFVGSLNDSASTFPAYWPAGLQGHSGIPGELLDDPSHFGSGATINQRIPAEVAAIVAASPAGSISDLICTIQGSTNDLGHTYNGAQTITHMNTCITTFYAQPGVTPNNPVIVVSAVPYQPAITQYLIFQAGLPALVSGWVVNGYNVRLADTGAALYNSANQEDQWTDAHPNRVGYAKMAQVIGRAITPLLNPLAA